MTGALRNDIGILRAGRRPKDAPIDERKVALVRESIERGDYEEDRKLEIAVDRLLDEIFRP